MSVTPDYPFICLIICMLTEMYGRTNATGNSGNACYQYVNEERNETLLCIVIPCNINHYFVETCIK